MTSQAEYFERINFFNDPRNTRRWEAPVLYIESNDGCTLEVKLPTKWVVCHVCQGAGTHVNPAIDCGGLSAEDFDADPDFAEDYLSGTYDVQCNACGGRSTVQEVDMDRLTDEQRSAYEKQLREEADCRAEEAAERRMGA